ncbi:MAG: methanethiol S-methyltransferase [Algibacter sp.]|uniref:methanethiol S-methyltransferase n=1 Tax=Algibacter sp. TaxID=1872428 RepID=UPI00329811C0
MKKLLIFLYGIMAYVIFLIAFLYAIGFTGNFIVPKSIDSGIEAPLVFSLLINASLLSIFAIQHSVMARPSFKRVLIKVIPKAMERSTYILLSSLALLLLYWQWQPLPQVIWRVENQSISIILVALFFVGWLIVFLSTFMINHFELFGLQQIYNNLKQTNSKPIAFTTRFFYGIVRHPIMLGFLIAFWTTPVMTVGHLFFTVMTSLYIYIAVKFFEEKDLKKFIGEEYEDYVKKVPMFIPFTKKRSIK